MSNSRATTIHTRVNITLPKDTLRLLDRVTQKGGRSGFVDQAVRFYIKETGRANLKKQLRIGALARASRDANLAEEWFHIDEEVWPKGKSK